MIDDTVPFHSVNLMSRWREENGFGSAFKSPRDNAIPTSFNYFADKLKWKCQTSWKFLYCQFYTSCHNFSTLKIW